MPTRFDGEAGDRAAGPDEGLVRGIDVGVEDLSPLRAHVRAAALAQAAQQIVARREHFDEEGRLRREVRVEAAVGEAGVGHDLVDAGVGEAMPTEAGGGGVDHPLAGSGLVSGCARHI